MKKRIDTYIDDVLVKSETYNFCPVCKKREYPTHPLKLTPVRFSVHEDIDPVTQKPRLHVVEVCNMCLSSTLNPSILMNSISYEEVLR